MKSRLSGRLAASLALAAGLLFAPAALASAAARTNIQPAATAAHAPAANAGPTATAADAAVVQLPLTRGPGVYMVRVTVSPPNAGTNSITVKIDATRARVLTVSPGHRATLQFPVRVRARVLTIRALGRTARPQISVLKWLMARIRVIAPPGTAVPVTPPRSKLPGGGAVRPKVAHGGAAAVAVPVPRPGIYVVNVAIRSRTPRRNRVRLQIGWRARSEVTNGRGGASWSVTIRLNHPTLMVRAKSSRARPELTLSIHRVAPRIQAVKPKAPSTPAAQVQPSPHTSPHTSPQASPQPSAQPSPHPPLVAQSTAPTVAPPVAPTVAPSGSAAVVLPQAQAAATGPLGAAPGSWTHLIFDDEFNSPEPWGSVWSQMRGNHWTMNNVSSDPSNAWVAGGTLNLKLASASVGGYVATCSNDGGGGFTMGYGYAEARIQLPMSAGQIVGWPAWWIVGGPNWPAEGETDILEGLGGSATSNYHGTTLSRNSNAIPGNWYDGAWHTYGVDREPGQNTIYWDGRPVTQYPTSDGGAPQCLILNIGSGQGPTINGATMQVDYVRVWTH